MLKKNDKFYYSLERITCPDIYRAGDGVHKIFLSIENKSRFNLLHPVYLYLEKKCFLNSKHIIANSLMVKKQIIDCYDINPCKIDVIYNGIELKNFNPIKLKETAEKFKLDKSEAKSIPIDIMSMVSDRLGKNLDTSKIQKTVFCDHVKRVVNRQPGYRSRTRRAGASLKIRFLIQIL